MNQTTTRVCRRCKEPKELEEYGIDVCSKDGINIYCRKCVRIKRKSYYKKNKEQLQEYARLRHLEKKNKEKLEKKLDELVRVTTERREKRIAASKDSSYRK